MTKIKISLLFLLITPVISFSQSNCWSSYRGDQALTGKTNVLISTSLKLLWTYKTDDVIRSSAVTCGDNIYIGSDDGCVY